MADETAAKLIPAAAQQGDASAVRVLPGLSLEISKRRAQMLAWVGRAGAIFLPVEAVLATSSPDANSKVLIAAAVVTAVWFYALTSAYDAARLSPLALGVPVASALGTATGLAGISILNFWLPGMNVRPLSLLFMAAGVFVTSASFEAIQTRSLAYRRRVLIVGSEDGGAELVEALAMHPEANFDCVGIVDDRRESETVAGAPVLGGTTDIAEIVLGERPDLVVLAGGRAQGEAFDHLLDAASFGFRVVGLPEFYEHAFGRVPVRHLHPVWFMSVLHLYQRPYSRITKRALDLLLASVGLLLTAPLFPLIALAIRQSGRGPILFRQVRLGEAGRTFEMLKFRTMVDGAEEPGKAIWAEERDPRVTAVGRFLRKTRLDELPQLWNVLCGEMSVIGPRPERPEFVELLECEVPFWTRRHLVKPGLTGWAQVRRGYTSDAEATVDKLSYDLYYLKHRSLLLDLAIVAKTTGILLSGSGAR